MTRDLTAKLAKARAEVARLERQVTSAPCREVGHRWVQAGGANCGCPRDVGWCSVPVNQCSVCGEWDYGENAEAHQMRGSCEARAEALI